MLDGCTVRDYVHYMYRAYLALVATVATCGCGGGQAQSGPAPFRSPTHDYPPPQAWTTSNGEIVGADNQPPQDKLREGASVGAPPAGVVPSEKPGGPPEKSNVEQKPAPCTEIGLVDESGKSRCKKPEQKR